ncbi:FAD/NAD(P)-binding domain-containing protein [Meredithblackwellia eburnea MCA 4105]
MSIVVNAMKLLHKENINQEALNSVLLTHTWTSSIDNKMIRQQHFDTISRFGSPSIFTRRGRLHAELMRFATSSAFEGNPAKVVQEAKVAKIDPVHGKVELEDGRIYEGDVLIGADGVNSAVRGAVMQQGVVEGTSTKAKSSGLVSFMSIVPISCLQEDPILSPFVDGVAGLAIWNGKDGTHLRITVFPMDNAGNVQVVAAAPEGDWGEKFDERRTSIIKDVDPQIALELFQDFHPSVRNLLAKSITGRHEVWRIRDIDALESWNFGKVLLIGDAAHAVTPHIGQGCNIAIEDAEALSFLLRNVSKGDPKALSTAFATFEKYRKPRASYVQKTSRAAGGFLDPEEAKQIGPFNPQEFGKIIYSYTGFENFIQSERGRETGAQ